MKNVRRHAICALLGAALTGPAVAQPPAGDDLFAATRAAAPTPPGDPLSACLARVRAFACPFAATVPIVRDVVGRLALELGIACPIRPGAAADE